MSNLQEPDLSAELAAIPQVIKTINLRVTAISKPYKEYLANMGEDRIDEIEDNHIETDALSEEISMITTPVVEAFIQVKENEDLEHKRMAKMHSADFEMALKRYQGILNAYIKKTGERLAMLYKHIIPEASDEEIEQSLARGAAPSFSCESEQNKEFIARFAERRKVGERLKELKEWIEIAGEIKAYKPPVEEKKEEDPPAPAPAPVTEAAPVVAPVAAPAEEKKDDTEVAKDKVKSKRKSISFKWFGIIKTKLGLKKKT
ncbi:hypothetical protein ABW20_dc0100081 [Dactylellina cionopaga]|nr:hypothetical protein ABW20_dc0100081 [Dactylellina cionopaga]